MTEEFWSYLTFEKRCSPHTLTAYKTDLQQFESFLAQQYPPAVQLTAVQHRQVRAWIASLVGQQLEPASINRKIATLRAFYRFLLRKGQIGHSPMQQVRALRAPQRLPAFALEQETAALFAQVTFEHPQDRLILELLYGTGIRLSELINLTFNDLDLSQGTLRIQGKGGKERILPLAAYLLDLLKNYYDISHAKPAQWIITGRRGQKAYPMLVQRTVKKYLGLVSNAERQSPHTLRHTFATHLLNGGAELNAIKELLGHSSLAATQRYTHQSLERLKQVFDKAHPKS